MSNDGQCFLDPIHSQPRYLHPRHSHLRQLRPRVKNSHVEGIRVQNIRIHHIHVQNIHVHLTIAVYVPEFAASCVPSSHHDVEAEKLGSSAERSTLGGLWYRTNLELCHCVVSKNNCDQRLPKAQIFQSCGSMTKYISHFWSNSGYFYVYLLNLKV